MRRQLAIVGLLFAIIAAACGGRLSEDEIQAQLTADGVGGSSSGLTAGSDGSGTSGGAGSSNAGGSVDGVGAVSSGGATSGGGAGPAAGGGVSGDGATGGGTTPSENAAAPEGGNGGTTDVGVSDTEIKIGNVTTLGGPVPGLFRGALVGTQARFAKANAEGGMFGRQFTVLSADDNFDAGQHRAKVRELQDEVFAFVGNFSLFDGAAASDMEASGVVDIGRALLEERQNIPNHYSPFPFEIGWPTTGCKYLREKFGDEVVKKMAIFWGNADAARQNAAWQRASCEAVGFEFVYEREFQATESNFTGDVVAMRQRDVQGFFVVFDVSGIARFYKSLHQQGFNPPLKYPSPAAYDADFIKLAGAESTEGTIIGQGSAMYLGGDADQVPAITDLIEWMRRIDPGQKIDVFALYGWLSAELLLRSLEATGPEAVRTDVLAHLGTVTEWNNLGMTPPINVAEKKASVCEMYLEVRDGAFQRIFPSSGFHCDGTFHYFEG